MNRSRLGMNAEIYVHTRVDRVGFTSSNIKSRLCPTTRIDGVDGEKQRVNTYLLMSR